MLFSELLGLLIISLINLVNTQNCQNPYCMKCLQNDSNACADCGDQTITKRYLNNSQCVCQTDYLNVPWSYNCQPKSIDIRILRFKNNMMKQNAIQKLQTLIPYSAVQMAPLVRDLISTSTIDDYINIGCPITIDEDEAFYSACPIGQIFAEWKLNIFGMAYLQSNQPGTTWRNGYLSLGLDIAQKFQYQRNLTLTYNIIGFQFTLSNRTGILIECLIVEVLDTYFLGGRLLQDSTQPYMQYLYYISYNRTNILNETELQDMIDRMMTLLNGCMDFCNECSIFRNTISCNQCQGNRIFVDGSCQCRNSTNLQEQCLKLCDPNCQQCIQDCYSCVDVTQNNYTLACPFIPPIVINITTIPSIGSNVISSGIILETNFTTTQNISEQPLTEQNITLPPNQTIQSTENQDINATQTQQVDSNQTNILLDNLTNSSSQDQTNQSQPSNKTSLQNETIKENQSNISTIQISQQQNVSMDQMENTSQPVFNQSDSLIQNGDNYTTMSNETLNGSQSSSTKNNESITSSNISGNESQSVQSSTQFSQSSSQDSQIPNQSSQPSNLSSNSSPTSSNMSNSTLIQDGQESQNQSTNYSQSTASIPDVPKPSGSAQQSQISTTTQPSTIIKVVHGSTSHSSSSSSPSKHSPTSFSCLELPQCCSKEVKLIISSQNQSLGFCQGNQSNGSYYHNNSSVQSAPQLKYLATLSAVGLVAPVAIMFLKRKIIAAAIHQLMATLGFAGYLHLAPNELQLASWESSINDFNVVNI